VGDHVGLGEVARRVEAALQLLVEAEVDIHLLIGRAVERPHRRLAHAAGRAGRAGEQHQRRVDVLLAVGAEDLPPGVLGLGQHVADEPALGVVGRRRRAALLDPRRRHRGLVEHHARIDPEIHRHQGQHDGADADAAPTHRQATASAAILDVAAFPTVVETHCRSFQ